MADCLSIVGSSRLNGDREKNDFYPTPKKATQAILDVINIKGSIWEPACGDGAISEVLKENKLESN